MTPGYDDDVGPCVDREPSEFRLDVADDAMRRARETLGGSAVGAVVDHRDFEPQRRRDVRERLPDVSRTGDDEPRSGLNLVGEDGGIVRVGVIERYSMTGR